MCLLIASKAGHAVSKDKLETAFDSNRDGVGYAFTTGEKIITKKFRKFRKFYRQYELDFRTYKNSSFLIHFRLSTHGTDEGLTNVHPFKINDGLVFAHNGVINNAPKDKILSDTQTFNNTILKKLPTDFLSHKHYTELISNYISHSKLAFLDVKGQISIINESLGHWKGGTWFSNDSYSCVVSDWRSFQPYQRGAFNGITDKFTFDDWNDFDQNTDLIDLNGGLTCDVCHKDGLKKLKDSDGFYSCEDCDKYFE